MTNKFDTLFEQVMTTLEEDKATVGKLKVGGPALTSDAREGKGDKGTVSFKKGAKVGEKREADEEDADKEEVDEKRRAAAETEEKPAEEEEVEEKKKPAEGEEEDAEKVEEKKKPAEGEEEDAEKLDELKMDKSMTMKQYFEKWRKENKKD